MRLLAAAVGGVVLSGASSAHAQDAVQWRVEDGGNGHWYGISSVVGDWQSVRVWCDARGGHLATCTNSDEWLWLKSSLPVVGCFVGGYQDRTDNEYREPSGGWRWVTGEEFFFDKFIAVDDCPGGVQGVCGCGTPGAQDVLFFTGCCDRILDDVGDGVVQNCDSESRNAVIEWSADCNSDGIVDYGQIRAGELVDTNANNIPDCCEQGFDCRFNAVQWRVEDGGNGHWYELRIRANGLSWTSARTEALGRGGQLATATSIAECNFIFDIAKVDAAWTQNRYVGPWLGGKQSSTAPGFSEPADGWVWDSGEQWNFTNWDSFNPSNGPSGPEDFLHMAGYSASWNDIRGDGEGNVRSAIVEYSADCNSDGIVDYGQIRAGELVDTNANNIPDCCEQATSCVPCAADIDESGAVNSVDLAAVLSNWGTDGGKYPRADIDGDGTVSSTDLAAVLSAWGPCE
jgi:hypothetical protein